MIVEDPLIALAKDNANTATYVDALDIGFFGSYGNTTQKIYTGLFRDASDSGVFKIFAGQIPDPTTTVDTANVNFAYGTLQTYLKSGGAGATGFIANSTVINITANSTLAVALMANTLSLSTPLPGTSGGTGRASFTSQDILVANSTNGFSLLSVSGNDGKILQVSSGTVVYADIDGGTF